MEYYDVIIVGAGIAGCGLAYNLRKMGYGGKVLVIDRSGAGANAAYGYKVVLRGPVEDYKLEYSNLYKGMKVCSYDKVHFIANVEFFCVDYKKSCEKLMKNSGFEFRKETAINVGNNILTTNKSRYKFKFLIDSSGTDFFLRKILKKPLPFRYWVARIRTLKCENKLDKNYFYYSICANGYTEELHPLENQVLHGDWQYARKIDYKLIKPPKKVLYNHIIKPKVERIFQMSAPISFVLPIVYSNYAFLGDSFGNAYPGSGFGVAVILRSSELLAKAIKNNDLKQFEKEWKKKYYFLYIKHIASKYNRYSIPKIPSFLKGDPPISKVMDHLKKSPKLFESIIKNDDEAVNLKEFKKLISKRHMLWQVYFYSFLRLKYKLMEHS